MSKINSGQAPSTLIPKYIGSDFDAVLTVANNIEDIKDIADIIEEGITIHDSIRDGVTNSAPTENAVYDALQLKVGKSQLVQSGNLTPTANWANIPAYSDSEFGGSGGPLNAQAKALTARSELLLTDVREALRRSYADAGYALVAGSFEQGGTLATGTDVLLYAADGKAYSWDGALPKVVAVGSTPTPLGSGGWIARSGVTLRNELLADALRMRDGMFALRDIVSVADFGAVGDWVYPSSGTDNTTYFQSALDYLVSIGGGVLIVPKGKYKLTDQLQIRGDNITIRSDSGARLVRCHLGSFIGNMPLGDVSTLTGYDGPSNITIDGGIWDGNGVAFYEGFNTFNIGYCDGLTIKNLTTLDGIYAHVLDCSSCRNVTVHNCRFLGYSDNTSDNSRRFSEAIQLDANTPLSFNYGLRKGSETRDVTISACYFGSNPDNTDPRFGPWPTGVGSHGAMHGHWINNVSIVGCHFEGQTVAGVRPFQWNDVIISGNTFINGREGVRLSASSAGGASSVDEDGVQTNLPQAGSGYTITGNTFVNFANNGVAVTGTVKSDGTVIAPVKGITISGNAFRCTSKSANGINLIWADGATVFGNVIETCRRGIYLSFVANTSIVGNNISNTDFEGIIHEETSTYPAYQGLGFSHDTSIIGNNLRDIPYSGILINSMARFTVLDNILTNVSTLSNTRPGVNAASSSSNGYIAGNAILDGGAAIKPNYGVIITASCTDVGAGPNYAPAATNGVLSSSGVTNGVNFHIKNKSGKPTLLLEGTGGASGDIAAVSTADLHLGHFDLATKVFTGRIRVRTDSHFSPTSDNLQNCGVPAQRWATVFAGTGSINTSDAREKTAPIAIDDAVLDAWGDVQLIAFQWLSSVAQKGDSARWHFGVIAQQVRDAFIARGLDGTKYGLLCYDEWEDEFKPVIGCIFNPETSEEEEYETGETVQTQWAGNRWGIRPDQCLFLEAAYQRRRCDRIEARLTSAGL